MKSKFKNDNGTVDTTLMGLIFSLTFSSLVISFLLLQVFGYAVIGNEKSIDIGTGIKIGGEQDYTSNDILDDANYVSKWGGATWTYIPNVGKVLTDYSGTDNTYMALKGVTGVNDVYTINYRLNNSVASDYGVILRYTEDFNKLIVMVDADGFKVTNEQLFFNPNYFYAYAGANQIKNVQIKTVFDDKNGKLDFYFQGNKLFTKEDLNKDTLDLFGMSARYYAGVATKTEGFAIEKINAGSIVLDDSKNIFQQFEAFLTVMATIILWNVNSQFLPLELNLLFIKTQLIGIVICIIMIVRGN